MMGDESLRVLIVEDELPLLEAIRDFLEDEGMATVGTSQPDEALRLAYEIHPQLIIMDVMLRGASGIEVAVKLRDGAFGTTPIIAISASALMLDFARQMGAFDAYLTKPFDLTELVTRARGLLHARKDA